MIPIKDNGGVHSIRERRNALLQSQGNSQEVHRSPRMFAVAAQGPLALSNIRGLYSVYRGRERSKRRGGTAGNFKLFNRVLYFRLPCK